MIFLFGCRTSPNIKFEFTGWVFHIFEPNRFSTLVTGAEGDLKFPFFSRCNFIRQVGPLAQRSVLGAVLNNSTILFGCFHQFFTLKQVVTEWFLYINIFACLTGPDRHETVPVIGSGDGNYIHVVVIEYFTNILDAIRGIFKFGIDKFLTCSVQARIGIHQMRNLYIFLSAMSAHM